MKTIVNVFSGEVIEVGASEERPAPYYECGKVTRIWYKDQLTKSGVPDSRKSSEMVGVHVTARYKTTRIAFTDDETEAKANVLRRRILQLHEELEATKSLLIDTYAAIPENQLIDK
jgi:hypothetical protein